MVLIKKLLENKEEQFEIQLKGKHWKRKRTKIRARERQVEKHKDGIVFDRDALMDKEQRLSSVLKNRGS